VCEREKKRESEKVTVSQTVSKKDRKTGKDARTRAHTPYVPVHVSAHDNNTINAKCINMHTISCKHIACVCICASERESEWKARISAHICSYESECS
jgi:hypothetical protein